MARIVHTQSRIFFGKLTGQERVQRYLEQLRAYHRETFEHSFRVGLLCVDLGYDNKANDAELGYLGCGGLLHDIGKLGVPREILTKRSSLDSAERDVMSGHPRIGFLELEDPEYEIVRSVIIAHHEFKKDPYPRSGLDRREENRHSGERRENDERIQTLAQMVAIADMYDALAQRRSYKKPLPLPEIKKILGDQFTGDPKYIGQVLCRHEKS